MNTTDRHQGDELDRPVCHLLEYLRSAAKITGVVTSHTPQFLKTWLNELPEVRRPYCR